MAKITFKTVYDREPSKIFSEAGSRIKDEFQLRINEYGAWILDKVGETDLYAEIQSHAKFCDIHFILDRFQDNPLAREQALNVRKGQYMDMLGMPQTFAELQQRVIDIKNMFGALSNEVKAQFDNSPEVFLSRFEDPKTLEILYGKELSDSNVESTVKSEQDSVVSE